MDWKFGHTNERVSNFIKNSIYICDQNLIYVCFLIFYWYQLIKMLQKFGNVEKFELLFHRYGPLSGQPRGYAFVTYEKIESSNLALHKLHGQRIGIKDVRVRLAKNFNLVNIFKYFPYHKF